jgi:hypothetical protein
VAIYSVVIHKELTGTLHRWTNQYFVNAGNDLAAADEGEAIAFIEHQIHRPTVHLYKLDVRQAGTGHLGIQRGINMTGTLAVPAGSTPLPLWNVVMVNMSSGVDRNDRKFIRCPLYSADLNGDALDSDFRDSIDTLYSSNLITMASVVNTWGRPFINASCSPLVHDRDINRSRRHRPGFHRGWVPD